ncbi:hypothetical protein PQX77_007634 [Marasmius sp. AFHP31]|nr:hypothetical protein PQX77_007634 [Marasmius sp. AFHP31]
MSTTTPSMYSNRSPEIHDRETTVSKASYTIRSPTMSPKSPPPPLPSLPKRETTAMTEPHRPVNRHPSPKKDSTFGYLYFSLSGMLGFREKLSLVLMIIFGGTLVGYCIARSLLMDSKKRLELTSAGEMFWFQREPYKATYIIHIFLSIFGGIFVGAQFLPALRRNYMLAHRINGYFCLLTIIVSNIGGAVVTRRSFGGELNVQSGYWALTLMSTYALVTGFWYARRDTRKHRKWMLRGVVYFSIVITGRLVMLAANSIISTIGTYYSLWQCDEVLFVLNDTGALQHSAPACSISGGVLTDPKLTVPVHCSVREGALGIAACNRATHGMGLWIGALLHTVGVEIYLRSTNRANYQKIEHTLQPRNSTQEETDYFFNEGALPRGL